MDLLKLSGILGSRHSSYTSHQSRISYTSHGDLLGTKEQKLRHRSRNQSVVMQQPGTDINHKGHRDYVSKAHKYINACTHDVFKFMQLEFVSLSFAKQFECIFSPGSWIRLY